jgi:hypothetical protein
LLKTRGFLLRSNIFEHCSKEYDMLYFMLLVIQIWIACICICSHMLLLISYRLVIQETPDEGWHDLVAKGFIEYIDTEEEETTMISMTIPVSQFCSPWSTQGLHSTGIPSHKTSRLSCFICISICQGISVILDSW